MLTYYFSQTSYKIHSVEATDYILALNKDDSQLVPVIIPFCRSGSGGSHLRVTLVEVTDTASTLCGGPLGTVEGDNTNTCIKLYRSLKFSLHRKGIDHKLCTS